MKSFLSHFIICAEKSYKLHCCNIQNNEISIVPFSHELEATEFHNGIILIAAQQATQHLEQLHQAIANCQNDEETINAILQLTAKNDNFCYNTKQPFSIISIDQSVIRLIKN